MIVEGSSLVKLLNTETTKGKPANSVSDTLKIGFRSCYEKIN